MSESRGGERPLQVTVAGWMITIAAALLVVAVFDGMTLVRSVAFRDQLASALDSPAARELGLDVDSAVAILRGMLFVAGVAAAASAVLGIYALQRHRGARIALTVLMIPVLAVMPVAGGMWAVFIAAGVGLLWSPAARDWFAGRPRQRPERVRPEAPTRPVPPVQATPPAVEDPPAQALPPPLPVVPQYPDPDQSATGSAAPPPMQDWGEPAASGPYAGAPPASSPYVSAPYAYGPGEPTSGRRPPQLHIACIIAWVMSGITAGLFGMTALMVLANPDELLTVARDLPQWPTDIDEQLMLRATVVIALVLTVWALVAFGLAVFAWLGRAWAWILLIGSAIVTAVVSLFVFPMGLFHVVAAGVVAGLLLSAPVRRWFAEKRNRAGGPTQGGPPVDQEKPPVW